ncbi:protein-arginine deiminase type-1-like [Crotalus tigris]|uniref:protein-arginine deiminase type-1-like n=1 Tax=Crotalus tigris TaxID=88082 RepID=UPI00192FADA2|nr:protein-arginine deiminase type-1-like [Crotalus tigris]XP_039223797.1 protein-arginine deiminase type-1-like [Crotalus tigris]
MAEQKCVKLSTKEIISTVHILGTELCLDIYGEAPKAATCFAVEVSQGLKVYAEHLPKPKVICQGSKWPLDKQVKITATMDARSAEVNDKKISVSYYEANGKAPIAKAILHITCIEMFLDADINRSGTVTRRGNQKDQWTWGPGGKGAILLVNCDRDNTTAEKEDNKDNVLTSKEDLEDMSRMILTARGPNGIFEKYQLTLHISEADCDKVGVFYPQVKKAQRPYEHVLGPRKTSYHVKWDLRQVEGIFYVEGLKFPDIDFPGLVTFHISLLETGKRVLEPSIFTDTVVFRVAPWIMTPNTLQPVSVYVCSVDENADFVEHIRKFASEAGCKFIVCTKEDNGNDVWIQDEMEFGYTQAPHKTFPVVFDSPRNRELNIFPFKKVLGPDFGYVKRELSSEASSSSLDGFGNLEVSPPVNVKGKAYPLGRILIGSLSPRHIHKSMSKLVLDFLHSQVVQSPIELYTDWLAVGHVDEFLSFVPALDRKGFRLLLASPRACFKLLEEKKNEGHGEVKMPQGIDFQKGDRQARSISDIVGDKYLKQWNNYCQECIDWNRKILQEELELTKEDIIEIPQLFHPYLDYRQLLPSPAFPEYPQSPPSYPFEYPRPPISKSIKVSALAYFPDMVNMIVLEKHLGIPKPFGPIISGQCCLEKEVRRLLEPLGLSCNFIDDFSYYISFGDIHCATNVRRKPFSFKWWDMKP